MTAGPSTSSTALGPFRVSTAVVSHPRRAGDVARLRGHEPRLRMSVHTGSSPEPSADNALSNVLAAWRAVADSATHHMVLQDDVTPCPGFLAHLETAIDGDPDRAFSMFCEWGSKTAQLVRIAALTGAGWAAMADPWVPAPAVVMPAEQARGFAAYLEEHIHRGEKRDAFLLLTYLSELGRQAVVSVPNLVEHDVPFAPSLLPNGKVRGPRRTACLAAARPPRTPWPSEVSVLPADLPYHSPHDLAASVLSDWDGYYGWRTTPAFEWLAGHGWSLAGLGVEADAALARLGPAADCAPLGADSLRESWIGAFALGHVIGPGRLRMGSLPEADHLARTALRSMAGTYRRVLAPRLLDEWAALAPPLLADAILAGAAAGGTP